MTDGPGRHHRDAASRNWATPLIFLLLVGFSAAAIWFWMNQEKPSKLIETAEATHPALEPLPPAQILDRAAPSDEEAVADGTLSRFDDDRWLESESFLGTDKSGRTAQLRIYILNEDYSWVFGDGTSLVGPAGEADLASLFAGGGFQERFCTASSLLAIGTSSFEGPQALNHRLARARGNRLISALGAVRNQCTASGPTLLAASLGEHAETSPCPGRAACPEATSSQRRVILVGAQGETGDTGPVNYDEALWSGLRRFEAEQESFFRDFRLADYDQFEVLN